MKKVLILQKTNDCSGGIRFVNKAISDELVNHDYEVRICSIREPKDTLIVDGNDKVPLDVINKVDEWEIVHKRDVLESLKKDGIVSSIKTFFKWRKDLNKLNEDYKKMQKYIIEYEPDYIIASHYQVLPGIPEKYLNRTINEHHTSYQMLDEFKDNKKKLFKLKDKIRFVWLTKASCDKAIEEGLKRSYYIYNPIRFETKDIADVLNNKKIVTITRLGEEKRIDLMIDLVNDVFKDKKFSDWKFEIYGFGDKEEEIKEKIKNNKKIKFMGSTNEPQKILLDSSINLNTSKFEGFSLSILEAYECGIPTITFNFGESCFEEIIDDVNGYIIPQGDLETYKEKLKYLMENDNKLKSMSKESKKFADNFRAKNIINEWIKIFNDIDKKIN